MLSKGKRISTSQNTLTHSSFPAAIIWRQEKTFFLPMLSVQNCNPKCFQGRPYLFAPTVAKVLQFVSLSSVSGGQSWALSVFFNFFNNKQLFFPFFIKLIWLGVGFLNRTGAEIGYQLDKRMQKNHFIIEKIQKYTESAQLWTQACFFKAVLSTGRL